MSIAIPFLVLLLAGAFAAYHRLRLAAWVAISATALVAGWLLGANATATVVAAVLVALVAVPVLLVSGGKSDLVSDRTVAQFLERVPHARHLRLPEATHMLAGDDNDAFTEAVLGFLRAQSASIPAGRPPSLVEAPSLPGVSR